jgi:hypothetical protein
MRPLMLRQLAKLVEHPMCCISRCTLHCLRKRENHEVRGPWLEILIT